MANGLVATPTVTLRMPASGVVPEKVSAESALESTTPLVGNTDSGMDSFITNNKSTAIGVTNPSIRLGITVPSIETVILTTALIGSVFFK